jgi:hypothetical protein
MLEDGSLIPPMDLIDEQQAAELEFRLRRRRSTGVKRKSGREDASRPISPSLLEGSKLNPRRVTPVAVVTTE